MILDGGVAACLLLSAHRAVIFAIAQLSCSGNLLFFLYFEQDNSISQQKDFHEIRATCLLNKKGVD